MFDCLEENYFNPQASVKPMNQLEIMAESIRILQEQGKRLAQIEQAQAEQKQELQGIREIVTLRPDSWRDDTKAIIDKIVAGLGGDSETYRDIRNQSYTELEKRAHCRLKQQLKNAQKRMEEKGASKTQIKQLRILDMIDKNQRLIEIYLSVVKDMAIHHGVSVDDMLF
jgi:hemolysin-activating ACP:hemolysin acyltransferase